MKITFKVFSVQTLNPGICENTFFFFLRKKKVLGQELIPYYYNEIVTVLSAFPLNSIVVLKSTHYLGFFSGHARTEPRGCPSTRVRELERCR